MNQNLRYEVFDLNYEDKRSNNKFWGIKNLMMPELSLASNSSSSESSETGSSRKRKHLSENFLESKKNNPVVVRQAGIDLQLGKDHPLPTDWEQCLDLQSGKMYFLNRKTSRKSWNLPMKNDQRPDLELNISSSATDVNSPAHQPPENTAGFRSPGEEPEYYSSSNSSSNNMVAMACLNCHLLVILSKSSPSCPNCKYVHSLLPHSKPNPSPKTPYAFRPLDTLSLFS